MLKTQNVFMLKIYLPVCTGGGILTADEEQVDVVCQALC